MQSKATTVTEYISSLPDDRRKTVSTVRAFVKKHLPKGYVETMQYGMISYVVPLKLYPDGYLGDKKTPLPYISLASQKNYLSLYLTGVYATQKEGAIFEKAYAKSGKKLDMGKSCLRFKRVDDLALDVIASSISKMSVQDLINTYEKSRSVAKKRK